MNIDLTALQTNLDDGLVLVAGLVLVYELIKGISNRSIGKRSIADMFASVSTQLPSIIAETFIFGAAYLVYSYLSATWVSWQLPLTWWTIIAALIICDFVYYWEHRLAHEMRLLWTQHAVHHSSRYMNIFVAVRFGPLEGIGSAVLHTPLVFLGFPPELIVFGVVIVLTYQTWIHTESIGRLGVLERFINTPSNHRVHHGCDAKYLDRNYGGILIIWDRLFGTYQPEEETPRYGLKRDFNSINPLAVWFSEWPDFMRDIARASSFKRLLLVLFAHPDRTAEVPLEAALPTRSVSSVPLR